MWKTVHARYSNMRYEVPIIVAEGDKVAADHSGVLPQAQPTIGSCNSTSRHSTRFATAASAQIREILDSFDLVQQVLERDVAAMLTGNRTRRGVGTVIARSSPGHLTGLAATMI